MKPNTTKDEVFGSNHLKNLSASHHQDKEKNDFDKAAEAGNFSLSERVGRRKTQQDSEFIGIVTEDKALKNPGQFLQEAIVASESKHKKCYNGTTVCSAIIKEDNIAVANLGDSRAALIFRYRGRLRDRYISVLLTQDQDLSLPRIERYVTQNGGKISLDLGSLVVNGILTMGGAIGDYKTVLNSETPRDCLIRKPDIFHYNIADLCAEIGIKPKKIIDLDLVVSCDGLWDFKKGSENYVKMKTNFEAYIDESGQQKLKQNRFASFADNLFDVKKAHLANRDRVSLACVATNHAYAKGSKDNISVAHIALKANKVSLISCDQALIATVCDGHGDGLGANHESIDLRGKKDASDENWGQNLDGLVLASSVAADLFCAAKIREIPSLEIDVEKQSCLAQLIALNQERDLSEVSERDSQNSPKRDSIQVRDSSLLVGNDHCNSRKIAIP